MSRWRCSSGSQKPLESRKQQMLHFLLRPCESFICFLFTHGLQVTSSPVLQQGKFLQQHMNAAEGGWKVNKNTRRLLVSYLCLAFKPWASLLFLIKALETRSKVLKVIRGSVTMTVPCQSLSGISGAAMGTLFWTTIKDQKKMKENCCPKRENSNQKLSCTAKNLVWQLNMQGWK